MLDDLFEFLQGAVTPYHAAAMAAAWLDAAGYTRLEEADYWNLEAGKGYYITRNGSSVIAWRVPEHAIGGWRIAASHSDSPCWKIKNEKVENDGCVRLSVEGYGGMIMSTWLDRPLSIAGRALVREGGALRTHLVDLGRDAVLIPNMPLHFNREINDGYKFNPQVDLLPLYGDAQAKGALATEIASLCGAKPEDVLSADLFLYNRTPGSVWGAHGEFFSCPRIDDLECAYTSLQAFLTAKHAAHISVYTVFDNEEVGSGTKQGADSSFLTDVLARVGAALGADDAALRTAACRSFMVSADNAHAVHPNHPEKYDAENRVFMNGGVVIKHNANQKYTTDAVSSAIFSEICAKAGVPVQHFANRSDVLGGSTLGNIANTHLSMNTVDIGLAQLAMHSSYETAGTKDVAYMTDALRAFYEAEIQMRGDGEFRIN